jgi:hypothetical protein
MFLPKQAERYSIQNYRTDYVFDPAAQNANKFGVCNRFTITKVFTLRYGPFRLT